ncbi:Oxidoreductase [Haplosporangium sp. Z 767]|nr:Oxidoreductase [Haplosporangium sp. Z 767]KAF9184347.1 Oxidoreductase [Haplosporangium sp. Z 11]
MSTSHYLLANPFAGQNIGHLRLAVVGDSGVGKTMFARQFVETLPEVLSHDWEPLRPTKAKKTNSKDAPDQNDDQGDNDQDADDDNESKEEEEDDDDDFDYVRTEALTEKFSSTMMEIPWDNMDADDEVPARNLVFLDTPGYGSVVDARTNFKLFMNYVGQTFEEKNSRISPFMEVSNNELMRSLVTGVGAHKFIDICFYLILHRLKPIDVEYMRMISEKANVVPIIAKADTQSEQEVRDLKVTVLKKLKEQGVSIYTFRIDYDRLIRQAEAGQAGGPPFAVSNVAPKPISDDADDQIPFKHAENELPLLRKLVLETQITNIRQFTVKKFINWRGKHLAQQPLQQQPSPYAYPYQQQVTLGKKNAYTFKLQEQDSITPLKEPSLDPTIHTISKKMSYTRQEEDGKDVIMFMEPSEATTPSKDTTSSSSESSKDQSAAFNPETGEINWDCPCLGGMAQPPCGDAFKEAFSCFVYSTAEPKGVDCVDKFKAMQDCFRAHPEVYADQLDDDDEEEEEGDKKEEDVKDETKNV